MLNPLAIAILSGLVIHRLLVLMLLPGFDRYLTERFDLDLLQKSSIKPSF